ncbi:MAG: glycoside hydrolase family 104 protein [Candidatus Babeliaceae bacterium]|nr:glycoside hydrolase family 104 protein [Candidatus Babeliaceae bacterium]
MKKCILIFSVLAIFETSLHAHKSVTLNYSPIKSQQVKVEIPAIATDKATLIKLSQDVRVKAFLDLLAHGEGTSYHPEVRIAADQYRISFCNKGKLTTFKDHPRERCCNSVGNRIICATAAGRYMFLQKTWDWVKSSIELRDFSPVNQDIAAVFLLVVSGAMHEILRNNIKGAITKASRFWAPMPGNMYNQPQTKIAELLRIYEKQLNFYQTFSFSYPQRKGRL